MSRQDLAILRNADADADADALCTVFSKHELPRSFYVLWWSQLDPESAAAQALWKVLFDFEVVNDPDDATLRDFSDPAVRRMFARCLRAHPELQTFVRDWLVEIVGGQSPRPWWKFW